MLTIIVSQVAIVAPKISDEGKGAIIASIADFIAVGSFDLATEWGVVLVGFKLLHNTTASWQI